MAITAKMVKELRENTGAGMMGCKKALTEAVGDMEEAVNILRKSGSAQAAKKANRVAAEGSTLVKVEVDQAELLEVNGETDFVDQDVFGAYLHMGGSIGSLVVLEGTTEEAAAKDVAMHVAAVNPSYVSRDEVPEAEVNAEREILKEQALNEGKPEKIVEKMVEGRLGKFFEGICLLEQDFVKDPDMKVKQFVEDKGATVKEFVRYEVGEGIEKKEEDFAEEVKSQMNK